MSIYLTDQQCQFLALMKYEKEKRGGLARKKQITCNGSMLAVDLKNLSKNDPSTGKNKSNTTE